MDFIVMEFHNREEENQNQTPTKKRSLKEQVQAKVGDTGSKTGRMSLFMQTYCINEGWKEDV